MSLGDGHYFPPIEMRECRRPSGERAAERPGEGRAQPTEPMSHGSLCITTKAA